MSTWLIGNVVPRPRPTDEMTDEADGVDALLLVLVVVPVAGVAVLLVGVIDVAMLSLFLLERCHVRALR
ncbi:hypothetical protein ACAX43_23220 [Paraburkholderia sp. IW21]|uniref:hypothetical protein n=1 Tax=Paraburkholderia sp. IW21 TaxID=3242488 RepID=UPI0035216854